MRLASTGRTICAMNCAVVRLPQLAEAARRDIEPILGVGAVIGNPLDAGFAALSSQENYLQAIAPAVGSLGYGRRLPFCGFADKTGAADAGPRT